LWGIAVEPSPSARGKLSTLRSHGSVKVLCQIALSYGVRGYSDFRLRNEVFRTFVSPPENDGLPGRVRPPTFHDGANLFGPGRENGIKIEKKTQ
jgi:hypothetical protein